MELILRIKVSSRKEEELQALIFLKTCCRNTTRAWDLVNCWPLPGIEWVAGLCCCMGSKRRGLMIEQANGGYDQEG
jgi:hypothetical protein